jgi:hypothetical protein
VVVDIYTKYAHFLPLKHPFIAQGVAKVVFDQVVKLHGMPKSVVSDRDRIFTSSFWKELFDLFDVKLARSSTYHPQTDGQSERVNQCLEMFLRCVVYDSPKRWKQWLALAEPWYNSTYHTALGCSPFEALYGYDNNSGIYLPPSVQQNTSAAEDWVFDRVSQMAISRNT